jgi:hypothetical protein
MEYLRLSSSALHRAEKKGLIKSVRIFGRPLFEKEEIDKAIRRSRHNA